MFRLLQNHHHQGNFYSAKLVGLKAAILNFVIRQGCEAVSLDENLVTFLKTVPSS